MSNNSVVAIIGGNFGKVNKYDNTDEIQARKKTIAEILIDQNKEEDIASLPFPSSYKPSNTEYVSAINQKMTDAELVEKGTRLDNATQNGSVFYMDTEVLGVPNTVMEDEIAGELGERTKASEALWKRVEEGKQGEYHNIITELYMHEQKYEHGNPVGEPTKVFEFANTISGGGLSELVSYIKNTKGANDLSYDLERIAGYHEDGSIVNGVAKSWDGTADMLDTPTISAGIANLDKNAIHIGSADYNTQMKNVYNKFLEIGGNENMALVTINGDKSDMPWLKEAWTQAGITMDEKSEAIIDRGHIDGQRMIEQVAKDKVFEGQLMYHEQLMNKIKKADLKGDKDEVAKLQVKVDSIQNNITNSGIANAARGMGADIEEEVTLHLAKDDTKVTQKGMEPFYGRITDAVKEIKTNMSTKVGDSSKKRIYTANRAVQADAKTDLFFSTDYNNTINTYNPTLMEAGHSYKLDLLDPKSLKGFENVDEVAGKQLLRITDMATDSDRKSFLWVNAKTKKEEIQERFLDTGAVEMSTETQKSQEAIDRTTKSAILDKARREKDSFYSVNSDRGYQSFERYYDTFEQYKAGVGDNASSENFSKAIKSGVIENWGENKKTIEIEKALPGLFNQRPGSESLIQERATNAVAMYDDFDKNHDYYSFLKETVDSKTMSYSEFKDQHGMANEYSTQRAYNQVRTKTLNQTKMAVDDEMINKLSNTELRNAYYENPYLMPKERVDNFLKLEKGKQLHRNIDELKKKNPNTPFSQSDLQVQVTDSQMDKVKEDNFKKFFGFEFDKDLNIVRDSANGVKAEGFDLKNAHEIDILGAEEGYTRIRTDKLQNIQIDLNNRTNAMQPSNRRRNAGGRLKSAHLDNIAEDLNKRGLISNKELENIVSLNNPNPKVTLLSKSLFDTRARVESTAKTVVNRNDFALNMAAKYLDGKDLGSMAWDKVSEGEPNKSIGEITQSQAQELNNYIDNIHVADPQIHPEGIETIAGMKKDEFIKRKIGGIERLRETVSPTIEQNIEGVIPKLVTSVFESDSTEKLSKLFQEDYGWTENNAKIFIEGVVKNNNNQKLTYANGNKVNLSHMIMNQDDNGYFITTTMEKQPRLHEMISNGASIDELKEHGIVYKLPKITEEYGGVRVMRQSQTAAKAITKEIILDREKVNGQNISIFKQIDTLDGVFTSLKYSSEKANTAMASRDMEKANSLMSNKKINENKSTSGTVTRAKMINGEMNIVKEQKMSVADAMLGNKNKIGDLGIYSLDEVLKKNDKLRQKLVEKTSDFYVTNLEDRIGNYKSNPRGVRKMAFEELSPGVKVWFAQNSSDIADTLLKSESFMEKHVDQKGVVGTLHAFKEYGAALFYGKDSGEASQGILNMIPTHLKVAGAHNSGGSRPLINQILSALAISENDFVAYAQKNLPNGDKDFKDIHDVYEKLNIKPSRSYITESTLNDEKLATSEGEHLAISTKMKYSTPMEFITRLNDIDDAVEKDASIGRIRSMLEANGIKDASLKEIKEMGYAIGSTTNLYEDSGAMAPKFARTLGAKTIIKEDFNIDPSNFKIGDILKGGTTLSVDKHGKETKYSGRDVTIVGVQDGKITAQQNTKYFDQKWGWGGSEKWEGHTAQINTTRQLEIEEAVFQEITGGNRDNKGPINLMFNPDAGKHEAWNSIFTPYSNAITNNIQTETDANFVNATFKKHYGDNIGYTVKKEVLSNYIDESGTKKDISRYLLVEGKRKKDAEFNSFTAMEKVMEDLKNSGSVYSQSVKRDIKTIEDQGIGWGDFATMSDNTIENGATWAEGFVKGGAKINHRSQSVIGIFIGNDPLKDLKKYRSEANGKLGKPLDALVQADIKQMFNDKGFIKDMEQVSNIRTSLQLSMGEKVDGARIIDLNINDVLTPGNRMSAMEIPKAFGTEYEINGIKQQVNGYRIKLDGMKIDNPVYQDLISQDKDGVYKYAHLAEGGKFDPESHIAKLEKQGIHIPKKIDEIFLPALDPNRLDEKYTLTEVQKMGSDLFKTIDDINSSIKKGSFGELEHGELVKQLNNGYSKYMQAMRYEMTDKNGLYKSSLNIQAENSARLKAAKIAAPILDKNGQYLDREYKNISTKMINGKVHYRGVVKVNPETLFSSKEEMNSSFKSIGTQIIRDKDVDNSTELFEFLNKDLKSKGELTHGAKTVNDLRQVYSNLELGEEDFHKLGHSYLRDVGFDARIMRDPAMLPTSYQTVRTYINDYVTTGTVSTDAVIAKWINGDGDGDEFNFFNYMFDKHNGGWFTLKNEDHPVAKAMAYDVKINESSHSDMLKSILGDADEVNNKARKEYRTLKGYHDKIRVSRKDVFTTEAGVFNVDYMGNKSTELLNLLSRFLKDSIGQVSNPNYYMRTAGDFYASGRGLTVENMRMQRNIHILTKTTEQNLIDIKSVKGEEDANKLLRIATSYKTDIDALGNIKGTHTSFEKIHNSIGNLLEGTSEMLINKNKGMVEDLPDGFLTDATVRDDMVNRIMSGTYNRGKEEKMTVEEIYGDAYKILQNKEANKVFWSPTVRQSDLYSMNGFAIPEYEKNRRASGSSEGFNTGGAKMFDETGGRVFTTRAPMIKDRYLSRSDIIYSTDIEGKVAPGLYAVDSVGRAGGKAVMNLTDMTSGDNVVFSGHGFDNINEDIKHFGAMSRFSEGEDIKNKKIEVENILADKYKSKFTGSVEGYDMAVLANSDKPSPNMNEVISKRVAQDIDMDKNLDMIGTVESLKQSGTIKPEEGASILKQMNDHIRKTGTSDYAKAKRDTLLGTESIRNMSLTQSGYDKFANAHFSPSMIDHAISKARYTSDLNSMKDITRYDVNALAEHLKSSIDKAAEHKSFKVVIAESMTESKSQVFYDMISRFKQSDDTAVDKFKEFYAKHASNTDFRKDVLNLDLGHAIKLIKSNDHEGAMKALGMTKVSFGKYIGMSLDQLGKEQMKEILTNDYLKQGIKGIDNSLIDQTRKAINKMTEMDESDIMNVSINPKTPNQELLGRKENDFITEARTRLNEDIKAKGATAREKVESKSAGLVKSAFSKAKTAFNEMGGTKKKLLLGGALALGGIGAINMYSSGSKTLYDKEGDYSKSKSVNTSNVKYHQSNTGSGSYSNVPQSNHRFYASQNNGLSVKVEGQNPTGSRSDHLAGLIKGMMGGSDVKVSTSMKDSRKEISDQDVDNTMSNMTNY